MNFNRDQTWIIITIIGFMVFGGLIGAFIGVTRNVSNLQDRQTEALSNIKILEKIQDRLEMKIRILEQSVNQPKN